MIVDFGFIPKQLTTICNLLVVSHHRAYGFDELPATLWDRETMGFVAGHDDLMGMLGAAKRAWRQESANEYYALLAAVILALEMLANDFADLGSRFPDAKRQANKVFESWMPNSRTRLLDIYLPRREKIAPEILASLSAI